jgi:hypothetical protein
VQVFFSSFFSPLCDLLLLHRDLYTKKKYYALSFIIRPKKSPVRCPERSKKSMKIRLFVRKPSKQYDQLLVIWEFISLYQTIGRFPG